jgi:hypothetical protein
MAKTARKRRLAPEPTEIPAPPPDPKLDPNNRAFACLMALEAGWFTGAKAIDWDVDEAGFIEIRRPASSADYHLDSTGQPTMDAAAALNEIERRWGGAKRIAIERELFPERAAPPPAETLTTRARFLKTQVSLAVARAMAKGYKDLGDDIEIAMIAVVRECGARAQGANVKDQSPAAALTRADAVKAILELFNQPRW